LDADHKENFRPEANLSLANDPSAGISSVPPLVATTEPDEKEDADEDEITFNVAWCCAVVNAPVDADEDEITFNAACNATWCRGVANAPVDAHQEEITFKKEYVDDEDITINAWCYAVANAPASDTVVTHIPLKAKTQQEIDSKKKENTSVSDEENANCNAEAEYAPACFAEVGWLSGGVAIAVTVIGWIIFGTLVALTGPLAQAGENLLHQVQNPLARVGEKRLHQVQKGSEKLWRSILIPLCFYSTILWDNFSFLTVSVPPVDKINYVPGSVRRKSARRVNRIHPNHLPLYFFLASWLVLSGTICVDRAAYNGQAPTHPFQLLSNSVKQTH
jgi:hypothetical protein